MASTRVSAGELEAAKEITKWARKERLIQRVEMLGYTDGKKIRRLDLRRRWQGPEPAHEGHRNATASNNSASPPRQHRAKISETDPLRAPQTSDRERLSRRLVQRRP